MSKRLSVWFPFVVLLFVPGCGGCGGENSDASLNSAERERLDAYDALEVERDRVKALERELAATRFSDYDYQDLKGTVSSSSRHIAKKLLSGTHPTGQYISTDTPLVTRSINKEKVTAEFTIRWQGAISENKYRTVYRIQFLKSGVDRLEVLRDTAPIKVDPQYLKRAEYSIKQIFD